MVNDVPLGICVVCWKIWMTKDVGKSMNKRPFKNVFKKFKSVFIIIF